METEQPAGSRGAGGICVLYPVHIKHTEQTLAFKGALQHFGKYACLLPN